MFEKILNKIPYVKDLKNKNNILRETNHIWQKEARKLLEENESFKSENQELRSYIGYLVNEAHIVMGNKDGRYFLVDLSTLEKYQDVELKPCPFCGERAKIKVNPSTLHATVICEKCSVTMKKNYKGSKRIEEVLMELMANDWNRRANNVSNM